MHVRRRRSRAINDADRNNENNLQIHRFAFPSPMRRIPGTRDAKDVMIERTKTWISFCLCQTLTDYVSQ